MRKRMSLLWTPVVLGLALMLPAAMVASSGFSHSIVQDQCINTTVASLKVTFTAAGTTNADRLNVYSWVDERVNHHWKETYEYATQRHAWAIDGQSHSFTISHARAEVAGRKLHIAIEARWYHNDGNQIWTVLHDSAVYSVICQDDATRGVTTSAYPRFVDEAAWTELHAANDALGWYIGPTTYDERRDEQQMWAADMTQKAVLGHGSREWTAVGPTEARVVREMARVLRAISEERVPK